MTPEQGRRAGVVAVVLAAVFTVTGIMAMAVWWPFAAVLFLAALVETVAAWRLLHAPDDIVTRKEEGG